MTQHTETSASPAPADADLAPLGATPPGLYRHYKGGWYEVLDTVRCSETLAPMTLYRALYGGHGLWVRPAAMFAESGEFQGRQQPRFTAVDWRTLQPQDLPGAHALVAHVTRLLREAGLAHRASPPEPDTCCGRGCNGCVWEGFYDALGFWREDAAALIDHHRPLAVGGAEAGHPA
ncbi:DUF1653 domain-containing protein [Hydrogenophaga sp. OTU3427]|uniref:DUF1653 domain-containing protein n=1 Tax=Hydrogenophaga sp. OTU3427 TaxID=3043856 RepID=UPI00406CF05E